MYMAEIESTFVPKQNRAIMKAIEVDLMALGPDGQTSGNSNTINGAAHRWFAAGSSGAISLKDFAYAKYALDVANVPVTGRVAIVDPSVDYALSQLSIATASMNYNPQWEGIVQTGMSTGMRFSRNIFGFDVYVSQNLKSGITETLAAAGPSSNSNPSTDGVANLFFSAASDVLPFVGVMRQPPKVDSEYNKDFQRDEYVTTCRYGFKLFRPENMVVVISDLSANLA